MSTIQQTADQVKQGVTTRFSERYEEFVRFAMKYELKHIVTDSWTNIGALSNTHCELVTDLYLRVMDKIAQDQEDAEFFSELLEEGMFDNYMLKAISTSCKSKRSTFNYQESIWRGFLLEEIYFGVVFDKVVAEDLKEREKERKEKENTVLEAIDSLLEDEVIGWHNAKVFKDYYMDTLTYKEISEKYQLPLSSVFQMVKNTRNLLIKLLKDNKLL